MTISHRGPSHSSTHHWLWSTSESSGPLVQSTSLESFHLSTCSRRYYSDHEPCQSHRSVTTTVCVTGFPGPTTVSSLVCLPCKSCLHPKKHCEQRGLCAQISSLPGRTSRWLSLMQTLRTLFGFVPGAASCKSNHR